MPERRAEPAPPGPRHRAPGSTWRRPLRLGQLWPVAAVVVLVVLGLRAAQARPRPAEGLLAADGYSLIATRAGLPAVAVSPDGLGARHVAVYATITGVFDRHAALVTAGRELLVVATVIAVVLVWLTGRRLGLPDAACAVAALLAGVPALLPPVGLVDGPARLAVPWLVAAGCLVAPGRPTRTAGLLALAAATMAVLLAPVALPLVLAGATAVAAPDRRLPPAARLLVVLAGAVLYGLVLALLGRWDPRPATAGSWGLSTAAVGLATAACGLVGVAAAWRLPRLRAPGVALAAASLVFLVPPARLAVLFVCLPLAALLAAALVAEQAGAARGWLPAGLAALGLTAGGVAAILVPGHAAPPDARAPAALLGWAGGQLPDPAALVAGRRPWAELLHAGGDENRVRLPGTVAPAAAPVVTVGDGEPPAGARLLARFDSPGSARPLLAADPRPGIPSSQELRLRRGLAAAILANPSTDAAPQARAVLTAAAVDQRLLSLLAGLAAHYGVGVAAFPPAPGEPAVPADGHLARHALVTSFGGEPVGTGRPGTERLLAWLHAQHPPFVPDDDLTVTGDGVLIGYRYVSDPDALVARSTS